MLKENLAKKKEFLCKLKLLIAKDEEDQRKKLKTNID
jgi:hypothetical protein